MNLPEGHPSASLPLRGLSVVVVEDDPDTLEIEGVILGQAGADVVCVDTVDRALAAVASHRPDVIISDVAMPGKDGWTLASALLSACQAEELRVPLVALSAHASNTDANEALGHGYDLYLVKPIHPDHLIEAVAQLVRRGCS